MTEQQEALERQTATAEVLQVINASPGDLQPVFETILEKAHNLCAVAHGSLLLYDGEGFHGVASRGLPEALAAHLRKGVVPGPDTPHRGLLEGARFAQVTNWHEIDDPIAHAVLDAGIRTTLYIPLRREGKLLGFIAAARQEVRPFSEKEIALLESFAAQAVIAMENARLLDEIRHRNDALGEVVQHGKRADSIVKNMLLHSREGSGERRSIDLNALVAESLNLAYHGARAESQEFKIRLDQNFDPAAGQVELFPQEITRVLLNLISNGFYAAMKRKAEMRDGYEPTLAAATRDLGDRVEVSIRDNGSGIPPEVKDKMFNPFFTTKPPGEGTGLGLSLSHDIIVKQHGGSIEVDTRPGEFTEFRVVLPRTAATGKAGASM